MLLTNDSTNFNIQELFRQPIPVHGKNKKLRAKRQLVLLNYPLFTTIYQKKGQQNFHIIAQQMVVKNYEFGFTIIDYQETKTFNYIINGTVMVFKINIENPKATPVLHKRLYKNEYFGNSIQFEPGFVLHSVKSVSNCLVFQLNLEAFYKTFSGHFAYPELKSKIVLLEQIWAFKNIKRSNLQRILLTSKVEKFRRNQILFRQRQPVQKMFVILQGEITLFKRDNQINRPFCVLSKGQIVGLQQIRKQEIFSYGAVCTHQESIFMIIERRIVQEIIFANIDEQKCQAKIIINAQLKQNQKILKIRRPKRILAMKQQSGYQIIQQKKNQYQIIQQTNQHQTAHQSIYQSKVQHQNRYDQISFNQQNSLNARSKQIPLKKQYQLKHPQYRQFLLRQTRKSLKQKMSPSKLSQYANKSFSGQKNLLFKYLIKKQIKDRSASQEDQRFNKTHFPISKELKVAKSSAVKNQKRKLKKSRKNFNSSVGMYNSCTFLGRNADLSI